MHKLIATTILATGAALMPAVAFCQTQTDSQHITMVGPKTGSSAESAVPTIPVEDQATKEQVDRLLEVMRVHQQMELMIKQVSTMMQQQVAAGMKSDAADLPSGSKPTADQLARQQLIAKFMDRATHIYTVDAMLADATPIYQRHISRSDIEAFIAFFSSSAGQHFLDQQPLIAKEYMPIVMAHVQENTRILTDEMKKEMDDLSPKEHSGSDSPAKQ